MTERTLPWSKELEIAVLCHCVNGMDPNAAPEICRILKPEYFYASTHKIIFETVSEMVAEGAEIDMPNVTERLHRNDQLEAAGGALYMAQLTDYTNDTIDYRGDSAIIRRYAMLRAIYKTGAALMNRCLTATDDPADISQGAIKYLQRLESELLVDDSARSERDGAVAMWASLETANRALAVTGIARLDEDIGGFRPGELIIVAADTGVGKTIFGRQIRRESCRRGVHGLYCSGEMSGEQLSAREAAGKTGIPQWKFRNPWRMERDDFARVSKFAEKECPYCSVLASNLSLNTITSAASSARYKGHLGFLVVDYDELVEAPGGEELAKLTAVVRGCKGLSMSHGCPVILLSQLRKSGAGDKPNKPSMDRLYGTGAKRKDASVILFLDRPFVRDLTGDEAAATIYMIKNRNGNVGALRCRFNVTRMEFHEAEGSDQGVIVP